MKGFFFAFLCSLRCFPSFFPLLWGFMLSKPKVQGLVPKVTALFLFEPSCVFVCAVAHLKLTLPLFLLLFFTVFGHPHFLYELVRPCCSKSRSLKLCHCPSRIAFNNDSLLYPMGPPSEFRSFLLTPIKCLSILAHSIIRLSLTSWLSSPINASAPKVKNVAIYPPP